MFLCPGSEERIQSAASWPGRIAVLVTTLDPVAFPVVGIARLYRERADVEHIYDIGTPIRVGK